MLVLTRKPGEAIRIGGTVAITIVHLGRGRVRLGIEAPAAVPILRGELCQPRPSTPPAPCDADPAAQAEQTTARSAAPLARARPHAVSPLTVQVAGELA